MHPRGRQSGERDLLKLTKFEVLERVPNTADEFQEIAARALRALRAGYAIE